MRNLDFYEFAGIVVPGAVTLFLLWLLFPWIWPTALGKDSLSAGGFGVFVVVGYGAGHLVQGLGNLLESAYWRLQRGMPTDWLRRSTQNLISDEQVGRLQQQMHVLFGYQFDKGISDLTKREWSSITRQIYATVQGAGRAQRIDIFNGNYGMLRGLATSLLISLVALPASHIKSWPLALAMAGALTLSVIRMHRFGTHYARELFIQFLILPSSAPNGGRE